MGYVQRHLASRSPLGTSQAEPSLQAESVTVPYLERVGESSNSSNPNRGMKESQRQLQQQLLPGKSAKRGEAEGTAVGAGWDEGNKRASAKAVDWRY